LLTKEVAFKEDLEEILGKRPYISREEELSQINGAAKLAKEATEAAEVASETEAPADTDPVV
jgi:hypothetical protein